MWELKLYFYPSAGGLKKKRTKKKAIPGSYFCMTPVSSTCLSLSFLLFFSFLPLFFVFRSFVHTSFVLFCFYFVLFLFFFAYFVCACVFIPSSSCRGILSFLFLFLFSVRYPPPSLVVCESASLLLRVPLRIILHTLMLFPPFLRFS